MKIIAKRKIVLLGCFILFFGIQNGNSQTTVGQIWTDAMLGAIKNDFARPPVQARNFYHLSLAMYDAWAIYDTTEATRVLFGKSPALFSCDLYSFPKSTDIEKDRNKAISFAAFRIIEKRFQRSPKYSVTLENIIKIMDTLGYDHKIVSRDYSNGDPAALGNSIAACILEYGLQDGSNEINNYAIKRYKPVNDSLLPHRPGNPLIKNINRWQPLKLESAVDQNGNPIPTLQRFQSPEWGSVTPFALTNPKSFQRDSQTYKMYLDPGNFPLWDSIINSATEEFKWNMELVVAWSAHLSPNDNVIWDISPNGLGNVDDLPTTIADYHTFYNFNQGGDPGKGHRKNPFTNQAYSPQLVPRGDYTRVAAQFWADGPNTETPPGHWISMYNKFVRNNITEKKFSGKGNLISDLEYDIKNYFALSAALHDAAISAWGIKGWYDGVRPISVLRYMATLGQCSDDKKPSYHKGGLHLIPNLIELVGQGDSLAGLNNENIGKIKFYAWRGNSFIQDSSKDVANVGWILGENWVPYQEKTFVTPPFAGYVSGHSTFSRAAAEILTSVTGSAYFPNGMASYLIEKDKQGLKLEKGPTQDVILQWATYRDASNQSSLSRIWGGIHPPMDDIPGRQIGIKVAEDVFSKVKTYFYKDADKDGYTSIDDCNDNNQFIHPNAKEIVDGLDNNCDGIIDNITEIYTQAKDIKIYPNPVHSHLTIENKNNGNYLLQIYNQYGVLVSTVSVEKTMQIDLQQMHSGLYHVIILDKNKNIVKSQRIIKN